MDFYLKNRLKFRKTSQARVLLQQSVMRIGLYKGENRVQKSFLLVRQALPSGTLGQKWRGGGGEIIKVKNIHPWILITVYISSSRNVMHILFLSLCAKAERERIVKLLDLRNYSSGTEPTKYIYNVKETPRYL